jgi:D-alanine-D-alanine ligase
MTENVLVLHNDVNDPQLKFLESCTGVLDQVNAVCDALKKLNIDHEIASIQNINQLPDILARYPHKIIFNLVEEFPHDVHQCWYVPALSQAYGRAFTGNSTIPLLLTLDKWHTKAILKNDSIPCPDGFIVPLGKSPRKDLAPGKYIVKPVHADASEGIDSNSVVTFPGTGLAKAVRRIHANQKQPAIVEQYIQPRELNVSVFNKNGKADVLAIAEIDFSAFNDDRPKIVDYDAKWIPDSFSYQNTPRILPAKLSKKAEKLIRQFALGAWHALNCDDYARVDFRMDDFGQSFVMEVNTNPDISPEGGFAAALDYAQISYPQFVKTLLNNALKRCR